MRNRLNDKLKVFAWSLPEWIRILNDFSRNMMNRIYSLYLPEFDYWSDKKKMKAMLGYYEKFYKQPVKMK